MKADASWRHTRLGRGRGKRGSGGARPPLHCRGDAVYGLITWHEKGQDTTLGLARQSLPSSTMDSPSRKPTAELSPSPGAEQGWMCTKRHKGCMKNLNTGRLQDKGHMPHCRTLRKINQTTCTYFKVAASDGFPELILSLEVFSSPGLSFSLHPKLLAHSSLGGKSVWVPFTHPSSSAAGTRPVCNGPRERCKAQSEPEPAEITGDSPGTVRDSHQAGQG